MVKFATVLQRTFPESFKIRTLLFVCVKWNSSLPIQCNLTASH